MLKTKVSPRHFGHRLLPIASGGSASALEAAVFAVSLYIASAGTLTFGNRGPNKNSEWHSCCVVAWQLWNTPRDHMRILKRLQKGRCAASGKRLLKSAEVDTESLFQVWRDHRGASWPLLLSFWGVPNLQVIDMEVHSEKCASEARRRASHNDSKDETSR